MLSVHIWLSHTAHDSDLCPGEHEPKSSRRGTYWHWKGAGLTRRHRATGALSRTASISQNTDGVLGAHASLPHLKNQQATLNNAPLWPARNYDWWMNTIILTLPESDFKKNGQVSARGDFIPPPWGGGLEGGYPPPLPPYAADPMLIMFLLTFWGICSTLGQRRRGGWG